MNERNIAISVTEMRREHKNDFTRFFEDFCKEGGKVWCRLPNPLQPYVRTVRVVKGVRGKESEPDTTYFPVPEGHRYLSVSREVVKELVAFGRAEVSSTDVVARLAEGLSLEIFGDRDAILMQLKTLSGGGMSFLDQVRATSRPLNKYTTAREIVIGNQRLDSVRYGDLVYGVEEKSLIVRLVDLFVIEAEYNRYLIASKEEISHFESEEWMAPGLALINEKAEKYENLRGAGKNEIHEKLESQIRSELAETFENRNPRSQKVDVALKLILETGPIYLKNGSNNYSDGPMTLLEAVNRYAKKIWKGSPEKTRLEHESLTKFNDNLNDYLLKELGIQNYIVLGKYISIFIRFTRIRL